jgi:hypothetical protein
MSVPDEDRQRETLRGLKPMTVEPIKSQLLGIGLLLKQHRLAVPPYQRPYAWERPQVQELFQDIREAERRDKSDEYFLGTVVLTKDSDGFLSIVDGQQRIVTTAILISTIRNYFRSIGDSTRADMITEHYLSTPDFRTLDQKPRLYLVPEDRGFYQQRVVLGAEPEKKSTSTLIKAQKRLQTAIETARDFVAQITTVAPNPVEALIDLLEFIRDKAVLVCLDVSSESNACVIFEVLNDRGLDLSVSDLMKNYVFRLSCGQALEECRSAWARMTSAITAEFEEGDIRQFIRQSWIAEHGLGRVDGFDQDEHADQCDDRGVIAGGLLASHRQPLEAFRLADQLLDASPQSIEFLRKEASLLLCI